jgi:squalene-associated FAD-dependent desaturase
VSAPHAIVVGGGLAGLAASVALADAGARVTLLEGRPRLGGATFSASREDGLEFDNGQHVFMRCCSAYLGLLRRLGVEDRVRLQQRLAIPVQAPGGRVAWIRRGRLPAPAHLAGSLLRFGLLAPGARWRAARALARLASVDPEAPASDEAALGTWLAERGAGDTLGLFDLLIRATLNVPAQDASLALAAFVLRTGFLSGAAAADLGWARVPLRRLHAEPAEAALRAAGARVLPRSRAEAVERARGGGIAVRTAGACIEGDLLVLAVPHEAAARLLPPGAGVDAAALLGLGRSPIVNLHAVFDRRVSPFAVVAGMGTPLQWTFDRSESAGLAEGQYLVTSLSAAGEFAGRSREELRQLFLPAYEALFPAARGARLERFFATAEPAATFLQRPGTRRLRPGPCTRWPSLFVAGAWTATGWPATMEGAVRSGLAAARAALLTAGRARGLPAAA